MEGIGHLRAALEAVINGSAEKRPFFSAATVLSGLAAVYGGATALRADLYRLGVLPSRRLPCPVVSVGNLTVGGTGKTPLTMDLAARLRDSGRRVCVLSRGYRGKAERGGAVVSDGRKILASAAEAGDEPLLIARRLPGVPVLAGKDRHASGMLAIERFGAEVFVLDDGYQHLRLARDLNLLLLDGQLPLANGRTLPGGRLREPVGAVGRSDALVFVGRGPGLMGDAPSLAPAAGRPRLTVSLEPFVAEVLGAGSRRLTGPAAEAYLKGRRCVAFAGIAENDRFFDAVARLGGQVASRCGFCDHHPYCLEDLRRLSAEVRRAGAECLVTTAKDQVRLDAFGAPDVPLAVMDLKVVWHDGGRKIQALLDQLPGGPRGSRPA